MAVAFVRKADSMPELKDGFGQKEMLAGTYEGGVRAYRCVLKAGCSVCPEMLRDTLQIFCLTDGIGSVTTPERAFSVNEVSFFVPDRCV